MDIVVGVDAGLNAKECITALKNLGIKGKFHLVHVLMPVLPDGGMPITSPSHPLFDLHSDMEKRGNDALETLMKMAEAEGYEVETHMAFGDPATELVRWCEKLGASLVTVASEAKHHYSSTFFGSIAKGLLIAAPCSLLSVKAPIKEEARALFATDHSEFIQKCESTLMSLSMSGLSHATIMTADDQTEGIFARLIPDEQKAELNETLTKKNQETLGRLQGLAPDMSQTIYRGHANSAIERAMKTENCDLLILGAQGHGFLERIMVGSQSLHQVITSKYSVLVLRPKA